MLAPCSHCNHDSDGVTPSGSLVSLFPRASLIWFWVRSVPLRCAPRRFAPSRCAPRRSAWRRFAPRRCASKSHAPARFAFSRSAYDKWKKLRSLFCKMHEKETYGERGCQVSLDVQSSICPVLLADRCPGKVAGSPAVLCVDGGALRTTALSDCSLGPFSLLWLLPRSASMRTNIANGKHHLFLKSIQNG